MSLLLAMLLAQSGLSPTTSLDREAPVQLYDEGVRKGQVSRLNCVGAGITCTKTGSTTGTGTITVTGGGGGGSANTVAVTLSFGASGSDTATTVVTGQAWVTATSVIVCSPTLAAATGRSEGAEDAVIEGLHVAISNRSNGVGFTVKAAIPAGKAFNDFVVHCTGA